MVEKFYLTKKGLEKIKKEYQDLKRIKLAKTRGESPRILHSEDLNPEYLAFIEDLSFLETRIAEIEHILKNIEIIKKPLKKKRNIIDLGAKVTLQESSGKINEFIIVGTLEANPEQGKISSESPIGKLLLGHKIGEKVTVVSPLKTVYKIKKVEYGSL